MRWGIFAPASTRPRVLVLTAAASRGSQAIGARDPRGDHVAQLIRNEFGLGAADVHVDTLLACGPSAEAHGHEVAACSQRLADQAEHERWCVELVVLVGARTAWLARQAGLLDSTSFHLEGLCAPAVVIEHASEVALDPAWSVLGTPSSSPGPQLFPAAADTLARLVDGTCRGHAWRPFDGEWRRSRKAPNRALVEAHVAGKGWLSPFRPVGAWPYCVLDVDLHNAMQWALYDGVLAHLKKLFPSSLFFQSSWSGGLHVYVRLPPGMEYADAAVWLTEAAFAEGLLLHTQSPGRFASVRGKVATRVVEVPLHPPRLPFGFGSRLLGVPNAARAVARFDRWLQESKHDDFDAAQVRARRKKAPVPRWPQRAAWARTYVNELELEALGAPRPRELDASDPWSPLLSRLAPSVAVLATRGCLAFGTRTATMTRLADALAELVEPPDAERLFTYWIQHREHHSEDIHARQEDVVEFAKRLLQDAFASRGIPTTTWLAAKAAIHREYRLAQALRAPPLSINEEECRRAAFHVLRLFHRARRGRLHISAEQLGLALGRDKVGGVPVRRPNKSRVNDIRGALVRIGLVVEVARPDHKKRKAAEYELQAPFWPPPPSGTAKSFQPD